MGSYYLQLAFAVVSFFTWLMHRAWLEFSVTASTDASEYPRLFVLYKKLEPWIQYFHWNEEILEPQLRNRSMGILRHNRRFVHLQSQNPGL